MGKIVPIALVVVGLAAGGGAGFFLKPPPEEAACPPEDELCDPAALAAGHEEEMEQVLDPEAETDFANLAKQFVIPIVNEDRVVALVVASMSLEVKLGTAEAVYSKEPKIRNEFLKVLFTHAHSGGFNGEFTSGHAMDDLRTRLYQVARDILGSSVIDVLIVEIVRQDM